MVFPFPNIEGSDVDFLLSIYYDHVPVCVDEVEESVADAKGGFLAPTQLCMGEFKDFVLKTFDSKVSPSLVIVSSGKEQLSESLSMEDAYGQCKSQDRLLHLRIGILDGMKSRTEVLWERRLFTDAVVVCTDTSQGTFDVHRAILASASPVFAALFQTIALREGAQHRLELREGRTEVGAMLRFIYTASSTHLAELEPDVLGKVLGLAHMFELQSLIHCSSELLAHVADTSSVTERSNALRPYREHRLIQRHWRSFIHKVANDPAMVMELLEADAAEQGMLGVVFKKQKSLLASAVVGDVETVESMLIAKKQAQECEAPLGLGTCGNAGSSRDLESSFKLPAGVLRKVTVTLVGNDSDEGSNSSGSKSQQPPTKKPRIMDA